MDNSIIEIPQLTNPDSIRDWLFNRPEDATQTQTLCPHCGRYIDPLVVKHWCPT